MAMVACPKSSWTILGWTPWPKSSVAHVCRRSWKRMSGNPALSRSGLNEDLATLREAPGLPP
jgi:hypothetical protein